MKIAYALCGEGLGHCTRALSLYERMPGDYTFYTYGDAYDYMKNLGLNVVKIKGLEFAHNDNKQIQYGKTLFQALKFFATSRPEMTGRPDLCISDWEPTISKFAKKIDVPCISITSQHKFLFSKPQNYKAYSYSMALICKLFRADHYIVSSFQSVDIEKTDRVTPVFGFIGDDLTTENRKDNIWLVYSKYPDITQKIHDLIKPFEHEKKLMFFNGSPDFRTYLKIAERVFATAGCQLTSECAHLGTPIHLFPIEKQYEQYVNAKDAERLGIGQIGFRSQFIPTKKFRFQNGINATVQKIREFV